MYFNIKNSVYCWLMIKCADHLEVCVDVRQDDKI